MLCTNQVRETMGGPGSGLITTGGRAFKFYASQRVEVKRIGSDVHGDVRINNIVVARVAKNKIAPPFLKAQFKITFGKGIDLIEQVIDFATTFKMITKTGAWYEVQGVDKKLNGHQQVYSLFESDELLRNSYIADIKKRMADSDDIMEQSMNISTPRTEIVNDELDEDVVEKLIGTLDDSSQASSNADPATETTVEPVKNAVTVEKAE
jgi:hypothetical protein